VYCNSQCNACFIKASRACCSTNQHYQSTEKPKASFINREPAAVGLAGSGGAGTVTRVSLVSRIRRLTGSGRTRLLERRKTQRTEHTEHTIEQRAESREHTCEGVVIICTARPYKENSLVLCCPDSALSCHNSVYML
jgi:hypothetical protein